MKKKKNGLEFNQYENKKNGIESLTNMTTKKKGIEFSQYENKKNGHHTCSFSHKTLQIIELPRAKRPRFSTS